MYALNLKQRDLMLCAYGWTPGFYTCEDWRTW